MQLLLKNNAIAAIEGTNPSVTDWSLIFNHLLADLSNVKI
jgi:hypothetical protein